MKKIITNALKIILRAAAAGGTCLILAGLSFWGGVSRGLPRAREWLRRLPKGDLLERCLDACRQFGKSPGLLSRILGLSMLLNIACVLRPSPGD